jgi:hypothetical protein
MSVVMEGTPEPVVPTAGRVHLSPGNRRLHLGSSTAREYPQEQYVVYDEHAATVLLAGEVRVLSGDGRDGTLIGAVAKKLEHEVSFLVIQRRHIRPDDRRPELAG